jgi:general secretion pathway protein I
MKFASIGLRAAYRQALSSKADAGDNTDSGESGFTLLEVLVALTILAIALTSLFEAQSTAIKATGATVETAQARLLAQAKLAETLVSWTGGSHGRHGTDGRFDWRVAIAPEEATWSALKSDANWRLYRVNVKVLWAGNRNIELHTLKLGVAR